MKKTISFFLFTISIIASLVSCKKEDNNEIKKEPISDSAGTVVRDYDGNVYNIVKIGRQIWMAENLKTTRLNDGKEISNVTNDSIWSKQIVPAYCWYKNNEVAYKNTYGALYNFYAVESGKLCPVGWHVPSREEWQVLEDYLGDPEFAGGKLKETGTKHWLSPNADATNTTGFSALPGGMRLVNGSFYDVGQTGIWWSTTNLPPYDVWNLYVQFDYNYFYELYSFRQEGLSVRCIKD
jgi:uncharacterized protein (TIGR02145 family)